PAVERSVGREGVPACGHYRTAPPMATSGARARADTVFMANVISLALPFFGLIFLGVAAGKLCKIPAEGLEWMKFFVIYIALPALFFRLLAQPPIEELTNLGYVAATTFATYSAFALAFCIGVLATGGNIPEATIQALAGSYSNIGYMGP